MLRGFVSLIACCCLLVTSSFSAQTSSTPQANSQPVVQTPPQASTSSAGSSTPAAHSPAAVPALAGFGLEDGTPVKLRLSRNLSSATDKKGDQVDFEVVGDVSVGNIVVIPGGSIAWATITEAEPKKRMGRGGKLNVNIDNVRLRDGEKGPLRAAKENKGGGHVSAMTGAIVATSIVFFPAAPLFLFMHGKDINIPKGTEIIAYIAGNIPLDRTKFEASDTPAASTRPESSTATVTIASNPAGADVELDGSFVGNTPSSLNLSSGNHTIKISKKGYKAWERTLKASSGTINLSAELEQESR